MLVKDNIILIPMEIEHINMIKKWYNNYENTTYTSPVAFTPRSSYEELKWYENKIQNPNNRYFIIKFKKNIIGFIGFSELDLRNRTVKLSIVIGEKKYRNKGIGRQAIKTIEEYLIAEYNIRKISVSVFEENVGSVKMFQSIGYFQQGKLVKEIYRNKKYYDLLLLCKFFES